MVAARFASRRSPSAWLLLIVACWATLPLAGNLAFSQTPAAPSNAAAAVGYLIPAEHEALIQQLRQRQVPLHVLREDVTATVRPLSESATVSQKFAAGAFYLPNDDPKFPRITPLLQEALRASTARPGDRPAASGDARAPAPPAALMKPLALLTAPDVPAHTGPKKRITYEAAFGAEPVHFSGRPVLGVRWQPDSRHYLLTRQGVLHRVEARTGACEPLLDRQALATGLQQAGLSPDAARRLSSSPGLRMNPAQTGGLFTWHGDLYFATFDGRQGVRLTNSPQASQLATFSPDGTHVAFVRNFDLYVVDLASQTERRLTQGGHAQLRRGYADWVYYEELYNRDWRAYRWSPNGSRLAFMEFDTRHIPEFHVVNGIQTRQRLESERYPLAGEANPWVRLGTVSREGGEIRWFDPHRYVAELGDAGEDADSRADREVADEADEAEGDQPLISHFDWTPDGRPYCYVQDRCQTWLDWILLDGPESSPRRLFRETTAAWVESPGSALFIDDRAFLWLSDRTGWRHIYRYDISGELLDVVTGGAVTSSSGDPAVEWEVRELLHVDADGHVYFTATCDGPRAENLYRLPIAGAASERRTPRRLTPEPGNHRVQLSPDGALFVDLCSSLRSPAQTRLYSSSGELVRMIDTNPVPEVDAWQFGEVRPVQIPARDGFLLEGLLIYPPDFDPTKKYPVWIRTYGGPRMPTVADSWQGGRVHDQMLATLGAIVLHCDPRSASGKGAVSAWTAYKQLGQQELRDLEDAVAWLRDTKYVDDRRIGIGGHSYGGYLAAYCLTRSRLFCAGIAGAPVTDWRNYDTIYTERYLLTPRRNPQGYEQASVTAAADKLHGRLLLLHGARDDNVHVENTWQLAHALQQAERPFEMMIYPQFDHGLYGSHYDRLTTEFICRWLELPAP